MRLFLALIPVALTVFPSTSSSQSTPCGESGDAVDVSEGTYGPVISYTAEEACDAVFSQMVPGVCDECDDGCKRGFAWDPSTGPDCFVDVLPTNPPTYIANVHAAQDYKGWISCAKCLD